MADDPPRRPATAAAARSHVRRLLQRAATPGQASPQAVVDDILLVVTELVTNAVRHGGGLTAFDARLDADTLTVSVSDASPVPPRAVARDGSATPGGFGWPLVLRLGGHVTVTPTAAGKTIRVVMGAGGAGG
ncbi:regulatory protein [Streptomyces zinciresistens K42]|uniref:Regulatory protein n=1 Tax=Streptomyces zinciresistens K42 TaxID=700597 RepID=G2GJ82_9ACTN|nr:regulatory protein [Streptomyces zinciresistens K42]